MNPALETLMLAFSGEEPLPVPERALFLGAEPHDALMAWPEVTGWQPLKPLADAWENAGFPRLDEPQGKWPLVLLLPGKSRDEALATFARGHDLLEDGGRLVVAMPNTAGASRFEKELQRAAGDVGSIQKHKCRAFHVVRGEWNQALLDGWRQLVEPRTIPGTDFQTIPGIFSADRIDAGSAFLAEHLPGSLRGRVADLGAGWGFLSRQVVDRFPNVERLDLFEADARALTCARRNLAAGAPPALASPPCAMPDGPELHFHWHDVTAGLPDIYDAIVTNPPFHTGQATDVDLGRAFIRVAAAALKRGGQLHLVANRQLPYEAELDAAGLRWRKVAENPTFKLLFGTR